MDRFEFRFDDRTEVKISKLIEQGYRFTEIQIGNKLILIPDGPHTAHRVRTRESTEPQQKSPSKP